MTRRGALRAQGMSAFILGVYVAFVTEMSLYVAIGHDETRLGIKTMKRTFSSVPGMELTVQGR